MREIITKDDKKLIKQIAKHFKFTIGDAFEIFRYAQYKSKTKNDWLKGMGKKAVSIKKIRKMTAHIPKFNLNN